MQFDIRVEVATMYKKKGFGHNRKQEQLVATTVIASQQIPDADVTFNDCPVSAISQHTSPVNPTAAHAIL